MNLAALRLDAVSKAFGATVAVDAVDLVVGGRELVALVGPSGCGKSTVLRLCAGLLGVDRGRVVLGDTVVDDGRTRLDPERRHVGLVFQEHALFPHLRVDANVAFGLRHLPRGERAVRRDHWLDLVGLAGYGGRYPHELSGGERQRVALARALAAEPRLMLLDEPFASLDASLRTSLRSDVVDLLRATGTPAVFVTHDQAEAMAVGDRVAVMRAGRIEQCGTPVEVFHRPRTRFVAGFMGEAAFLPITPGREGGGVTELGAVALPRGAVAGAVAMVRPDDVTFRPCAGGGSAVVAAEFQGPTWRYTLRLPSGTLVTSTRAHLVEARPGDRVEVSLRAGHEPVAVVEE